MITNITQLNDTRKIITENSIYSIFLNYYELSGKLHQILKSVIILRASIFAIQFKLSENLNLSHLVLSYDELNYFLMDNASQTI